MTAKDRYLASNDWRGPYVEPERPDCEWDSERDRLLKPFLAERIMIGTATAPVDSHSRPPLALAWLLRELPWLEPTPTLGRGSVQPEPQPHGKDVGPRPSETEEKP